MAKKTVKTVTTTVSDETPKKKKKRKTTRKKRSSTRKQTPDKISKEIAESLVALQKINLDLAEKFDKLASEISSLLKLFEMTALSFSKHPAVKSSEKDKEFLDKIDRLLDQNKTIAKGLTLMEGKIKERMTETPQQNYQASMENTERISRPATGKPLPRF